MAGGTNLDTTALDAKFAELSAASRLDFAPLLAGWAAIVEEENRAGILAGLDAAGRPLAPVTYRPRPATHSPDFTPLAHDNLSGSAYRVLYGPPTAPRGAASRVITRFHAEPAGQGDGWSVLGSWDDVVDANGLPFLEDLFAGRGDSPPRDLAGVRPNAVRRCVESLRSFVLKALGGG
ncbi:hypothetical protein [Aquisphaera insulae]|uniref:hypothetical protein n=1 Tax=Aquisphaera insulae TaxID=2712864 RepID=UPI0013ED2D8C|nr:hypothetical protein [Aquisphaera insulae]